MGLRCGICRDSKRGEIERAMLAGDSDVAIAKQFNHYPSTVTVHRAKHLEIAPTRLSPNDKAQYREALRDFHIASVASRVGTIQSLIDDLQTVKEERARAFAHCVGGATGLVVSRQKALGKEVVWEEEIDLGLVREIKSLVQVAASLIGEWDPSGAGAIDAGAGANVTIYQSIQGGNTQQAIVSADPKLREKSLINTPIRALEASIGRDSIQSVYGDNQVVEAGALADDEGGD